MDKQKTSMLNKVDKMQIASLILFYVGFVFVIINMIMFNQFIWQSVILFVSVIVLTVGVIMKKKISFNDNKIFARELLQLLMTSVFILLVKFIVKFGNIAIKKGGVNINLDVFVVFCMVFASLYLLYAVIIQIIVSINLIKLHKQEKITNQSKKVF